MLLPPECALLLVRNYFNEKPDGPYNQANAIYSVPRRRLPSRNLATKVGDVNGHCCDEHPQSLYVPKSKEFEFVVPDRVEANVLAGLRNMM
jgi:hypothetical protein